MVGARQAEQKKIFGQQTPRRWGWGTPLKKRAATRMKKCYIPETFCQLAGRSLFPPPISSLYAGNFSHKVAR